MYEVMKKSKFNINAGIVSKLIDGKEYFEIKWFNKETNEVDYVFGSFNKSNVEGWLKEYFN